jgi:PAS domain S-box-containing protein
MKHVEKGVRRRFGNELVGDIPWGTHLCQFYETKQDLIDILVPYFAEGLRSNEFCMWVTSQPLEVKEATEALKEAVPDLEEYVRKGQIEIISYSDWYLLGGKFDSNRVLQGWVEKENAALKRGFEGLRLTGNTLWIERDLWKSFVDYEEAINSVIGEHRIIAVCTYSLTCCSGMDVVDVVRNHVGTLIKQGDKWYLVEDAARRKAANGALRSSERKYSALFENMQDGFAYHKVLFDKAGRPVDYVFLEINDAFERLTGLKRENVLGKTVTEVLPGIENDPADWIGKYGKVATTGQPMKFESYSAPLQKWHLVFAYSPEEGYFVATFEDVSERKRTEDAIRRLNERFEMAQHAAGVGVWDWDLKTGHIEWTPEMFPLFGLDPQKDAASFESWNAVLHPEDREKASAKIDEALEKHSFLDSEYRIVRPDGQVIWINALGKGIYDDQNKPTRMSGICIDVTERKKAEEILREQNLVISSASDAVFSTDKLFIIKSWNRAAERIFGWKAKEVIGKATISIFNPVYPALNGTAREQAIAQLMNNGFWRGEILYHKKDGSPIPVSVSASLVKDENCSVTGVVAIVHDITARKMREKALREAQHDLNHAQAVAKTGSWRLDTRRDVLRWSDETYRMFGVPMGTPLTYENFLEMIHPDDREYVDEKWKAGLRGEPYDVEHRIIVDGKVKWVREKAELEFDKDGTLLGGFGTTQDITDLVEMREKLRFYSKNLEELVEEKTKQLKDAEKLITIGQTAGMVGHDIRNPLQSIDGAIYLAKEELQSLPCESHEKKELREILNIIEDQTHYIDHIVADLQDFARTPIPQLRETNIQDLISESISTVKVPKNIEVRTLFQEDLGNLTVDPLLIKRVTMNLIANAFQAMPNGGELTIKVSCNKEEACISIEDTGVGIAEEHKPKIFTPLFTTKAKGQGFGLAVCKKLLEAQSGEISFESEEGKGSTFTIKLPLIRKMD